MKSAVHHIRPSEVFLYCEFEPNGPWWDLTRQLVTVKKIQGPKEIFGNPLLHPAHQADVVRLEKLLATGGIYLDADVFVHKSFDDLLQNSAVLGEECVNGQIVGLCNAVMLAEPGAAFLHRWHSTYQSFRSKGRDQFWDEHSVRIPHQLAREFPHELTILPPHAFFWPTFTTEDLALIFESSAELDRSNGHATHLWESPAWDKYLEHLTPRRVRSTDSNFHQWARPLLEGVPDDYGKPSYAVQAAGNARRLRRRVRSAVRRLV